MALNVGHLVFLIFEEFMLIVCFICAAALFYAEIFFLNCSFSTLLVQKSD